MLNSLMIFCILADKNGVKKREGTASERASAMVLGGALCSRENGKYPGPLFARKKNNYLGKFFLFMLFVGSGLFFWDSGRNRVTNFAAKFFKTDKVAKRSLASEKPAKAVMLVPNSKSEEQGQELGNERQ